MGCEAVPGLQCASVQTGPADVQRDALKGGMLLEMQTRTK